MNYEGIIGGGLRGDGKLLLLNEHSYGWIGVEDGSIDVDGINVTNLGGLLVDAASCKAWIFPSLLVGVDNSATRSCSPRFNVS